jgi:hypothetical protein
MKQILVKANYHERDKQRRQKADRKDADEYGNSDSKNRNFAQKTRPADGPEDPAQKRAEEVT